MKLAARPRTRTLFLLVGLAYAGCIDGDARQGGDEPPISSAFASQPLTADPCAVQAGPLSNTSPAGACVCNTLNDSACCDPTVGTWSAKCVREADYCGFCGHQYTGDPCKAHGSPGSADVRATDCVCEMDAFCCFNTWDSICAGEAKNQCAVTACNCGQIGQACCAGNLCQTGWCSAGTCAPFTGDPCAAHGTPGSGNNSANACVCGMDPFCCNNQWDSVCVGEATNPCGVACPNTGDACSAHSTPGSADANVTACVCGIDSYCCNNQWDGICVNEAENQCGANCPRIVQIAAGVYHTCALRSTGVIRCWGNSANGQLGHGNTNNIGDDELPSSMADVDVGGTVIQLAGGRFHTCALLSTGNVRCWGDALEGQLGYGNKVTIGDTESPASAGDVNVGGAVVQIDAGDYHTCALLGTGNVRCWGLADRGQLGYGNTNNIGDNETPASAGDVNVGGVVTQISAGRYHTCALLASGNVRCWGEGTSGVLGYGNLNVIGDNEAPASAGDVNLGGTASQISAGGSHNCALLNQGRVRCWGSNFYGALGYGNMNTIGDDEVPASAGDVNVGGAVTELSAGENSTCALLDTGGVRCWGTDLFQVGLLGYANTSSIGINNVPASAGDVNVGGFVSHVTTGGWGHTCALLASGGVRCWGDASLGQLGYGNTTNIGDDETPASAGNVQIWP